MNHLLTTLTAFALAASPLKSQTPIRFAAGSDSGVWVGYVSRGEKTFSLGMAKGQRLWLRSAQVYTWSVVSPTGRQLGCRGYSYCTPNEEQGLPLPESGNHIVRTSYRLTGGAGDPKTRRRYVAITFTVR